MDYVINLLIANNFIILLCAYLLGSIPFGYLLTKFLLNKDIRGEGSGNIGATNVTRVLGKKWGIITFLFDSLKGVLAIIIAKLLNIEGDMLLIVGLSAVLGHIFPIWLHFKGGKGVSTALAVLTVLMSKVAFVMGLIWIITFKLTKISSLSAIIAFTVLPFLTLFFKLDVMQIIFSLFLSAIILYKHRTNIKKIIKKTENKF